MPEVISPKDVVYEVKRLRLLLTGPRYGSVLKAILDYVEANATDLAIATGWEYSDEDDNNE